MRVLHIIPSMAPQRGGPSFVMRAIARGLSDQGVVVDIATTNDNGRGLLQVEFSTPRRENGATYRYFARQTRFYCISPSLAVWLWRHVRDYDLVHVHALFSFPSTIAAIVARVRRVPYIVRPLGILNRWGMENRRPFLKQLSFYLCERQILRNAYAVQFTSELERMEAEDLATCSAAVIPNPVELQEVPTQAPEARKQPRESPGVIYLFLSRIDEKKGVDLLLKAFALVRRALPESRLVIAGDGPASLVDSLHSLARTLGLNESVEWSGFVEGEAKRSVLAASDVFVLPSYSENFGVSVVEAMAAGLPVVISDRVGIHPEISRSESGLVAECDPEAFAQAMISMGRDPGRWREMGSSGREVAEREFSLPAVSRRLIELYRGAMVHPVAPVENAHAASRLPGYRR